MIWLKKHKIILLIIFIQEKYKLDLYGYMDRYFLENQNYHKK